MSAVDNKLIEFDKINSQKEGEGGEGKVGRRIEQEFQKVTFISLYQKIKPWYSIFSSIASMTKLVGKNNFIN